MSSHGLKSFLYGFASFVALCSAGLWIRLLSVEQQAEHIRTENNFHDALFQARMSDALQYMVSGMSHEASVGPFRSHITGLMVVDGTVAMLASVLCLCWYVKAIQYGMLARSTKSVNEVEFEEDPLHEGVLMYPA